jgi:hypothetical protein
MRKPSLLVASVIAATAVSCCHIPPAAAGLPVTERPRWTTDLRTEGFAGDEWHTPGEFEAVRQIAFGSNDELVVASASGPFAKPNIVHAFALSLKDGKVIAKADWESRNWPFLFATSKGEYAVVSTRGMELFAAGLRETGTIVPDAAADKASPDGRYLAVTKTIPGHGVIYFLDATTLKPTGTEIRDTYAWSVGDNSIVATATRSRKTIVEVDDGRRSAEYQSDCGDVRPQFIAQNLVALLGCNRVEVVSVSGTKIFAERLVGAPSYLVAASRNGGRFVVSQQFERPGDPPGICAERFTVFDVNLRRAILVTESHDLKGLSAGHSSGYALSPDGTFLAINSAGKVRLFALP